MLGSNPAGVSNLNTKKMKITKIEIKNFAYEVTFVPNWLEKIFGVKSKVKKFKPTGNTYAYGGGNIYLSEDGSPLENGNWIAVSIDQWKNKF